ncbi:unnamed protein product [Cuscuta campestris]|uniref:Uncharacterized protein n=1 Tax=Cuscuta campestris TaxID=132261 RepID=A0A484N6V0_9ASTE|nr:unnamed protein product [Cuscuta campestris]
MVQSTGAANAEYLQSLVLGVGEIKPEVDKQLDGVRRGLASSRWAAAAQYALGISLSSSQNDLIQLEIEDDVHILNKTKDAVVTLQGVLEGKHNNEIEETLDRYQVSKDRWWFALYRVVEGLATMSRLAPNRLQHGEFEFEGKSIDWDHAAM